MDNLLNTDSAVPFETRIYYSKTKAIIWLVISIALLAGIILLGFKDVKSYSVIIIFGMAFLLYIFFINFQHLRNKNPQIILSNKGLQAGKQPFYKWKDLHNEEVIAKSGRGKNYYLKYDSPAGTKEIFVSPLDVNSDELERLLIVYRNNSNAKP